MKKMGTKLATGRGKNLYEYWGASVAEELGSRLQAIESDDERFLVNIASAECKPPAADHRKKRRNRKRRRRPTLFAFFPSPFSLVD